MFILEAFLSFALAWWRLNSLAAGQWIRNEVVVSWLERNVDYCPEKRRKKTWWGVLVWLECTARCSKGWGLIFTFCGRFLGHVWCKLCVDRTDKQIMIEICGPLEKIANCMFFQRTEILSLSWKLCRATVKRNAALKFNYTWKVSFPICRAYLQSSAAEGHIAPTLQSSISRCVGDWTVRFPSCFWSHPQDH